MMSLTILGGPVTSTRQCVRQNACFRALQASLKPLKLTNRNQRIHQGHGLIRQSAYTPHQQARAAVLEETQRPNLQVALAKLSDEFQISSRSSTSN